MFPARHTSLFLLALTLDLFLPLLQGVIEACVILRMDYSLSQLFSDNDEKETMRIFLR
jgi:hypothetical protein